jgi:hypothetical protein
MADPNDDPDEAAARLEAALERIAQASTARAAPLPVDSVPPVAPNVGELASRLDSLIGRLRDALDPR